MLSINMSQLWSDDIPKIVKAVDEATNNISVYYDSTDNSANALESLYEDIREVCNFWTGKTSVGHRKDDEIKQVFQNFFKTLIKLLLKMKDSEKNYESEFANALLYQGKVYRSLGYCSSRDIKKKAIQPEYNEIYVSWSKEPENVDIERKLYGKITWLEAEIKPPYFGIDLEKMGVSKGNEREVVFPTLKDYVTRVEVKTNE